MRLYEFKDRVRAVFGPHLEHATPANVREFLDTIQQELWLEEKAERIAHTGNPNPPLELSPSDSALTYETVIRQFFVRALHASDEHALLLLWMLALDLAYSGIEEMQAESLNRLFREPLADKD
jgi:hypothetical protein